MSRLSWLLLLISGSACESGLSLALKLTIPADVAAPFTSTAPGVVMTDQSGEALPYFVLCGQPFTNPRELVLDEGFGCMGSRKGTTVGVKAWVQPMPASWDPAATCAAVPAGRSYDQVLSLDRADAGATEHLASTPATAWPQGSDVGTWRGDLSPCGGVLNTVITLAAP